MRSLSLSRFAALLLFAPLAARADEKGGDAEALFNEARTLMVHGDYAAACPKLERSDVLDPGIGTEFNLARCYDLAGSPARAWAMYQRVIYATVVAGQTERENTARRLQDALAPRIAYATIDPAPETAGLAGLEIRCDGEFVELNAGRGAAPLDPGVHVIVAAAPARVPWRTQITIQHEGERVQVVIPPLAAYPPGSVAAPAPVAPVEPAAPAPLRPTVAPDSRRAAPSANLQRPMAAVALGTAVVAAGIGVYFGVQKLSLASEARDHCGADGCDAEGVSASRNSIPVGNASTAAFIASGALLAASAILWFTAPRSAPAHGLRFAPAMSESGGGLLTMGQW